MATTLSPSNLYQVALGIPGNTPGASAVQAANGRNSPTFFAPNLSAAQTAAQSQATFWGCEAALYALGNVETPTIYQPGAQGSTVSAPTGIQLR